MSFQIFKKYPEVNAYLANTESMPVFIKLMATILFIRQKLDYTVNVSDVFYNNASKLDPQLFCNVEKDDLPALLELFVKIICDYVSDTDVLEDDESDETKQKICCQLRKYAVAN